MSAGISETVTPVKEVVPLGIAPQAYYAPSLCPIDHGPASLWISLQGYHGQMGTMLFGWWWNASPKCAISCLAEPPPTPLTWRTSSYIMYGNTMVSPRTLSPTKAHNSPVTSGDNSAPVLGFHPAYPPPSIPRLMGKRNGQTKQWSSTSVPLFPTSRMTGQIGYQWPSSRPTTNSQRLPRSPPSSPTPVIIPGAPLTCPPHLPAGKPRGSGNRHKAK